MIIIILVFLIIFFPIIAGTLLDFKQEEKSYKYIIILITIALFISIYIDLLGIYLDKLNYNKQIDERNQQVKEKLEIMI